MPQTSLPAGRSYASGTYPVALLGDTIGDNFDAAASRFGDREALVDVAACRRWSYREMAADVTHWPAGCSAARSVWATGSGSGRLTAPSGR
jgi:fatty-acyl-CoA synthase